MSDEVVPPSESPGLGLLGPRTRHLLALEFGSRAQFDDDRLEWRRLFSELLGTFMLVLVAAGDGILHGEVRSAWLRLWWHQVSWSWGSSCSWGRSPAPT
jgi:hypothetical protein